jgi:hypothetical protein
MNESSFKKVKELKIALWFGIIILIIGIIAAIDKANSDLIDNITDIPKECFSNQKLITNAIKGYNANTLKRIEEALPGKDFEDLEELLIKNWYLNSPIKLPAPECSYGYVTEDKKEIVFCKHHGSADSVIIPAYNTTLEKPFSEKYLKKIEELKNARTKKESAIAQIRNLIDPTILIIGGLLFIILISDQIYRLKKS